MPGSRCCGRRKEDGTFDVETVRRAVAGQAVNLSPAEFRAVTYKLSKERGWGLALISNWTSYGRSQVAAVLAEIQRREARRG